LPGDSASDPASMPASLDAARAALAGTRTWIVTDGKAGDLAQALGIAERLALAPDIRTIAPRAPWRWLMPYAWELPFLAIDPAETPGRTGSPLGGAMPDLVIASGRRAAAYLPAIKRASGGRTFTVFLKDPRVSARIADFLWVPAHDTLRGPNVLATQLSPHRFSPERLAALRQAPSPRIAALPSPRVALLVGGNGGGFSWSEADIARFTGAIRQLGASGAGLMATLSRRTPPALAEAMRFAITEAGGRLWDGTGDNPLPDFLAHAEALVVTADSVNMVGEALAAGRPVHLFRPSGGSQKLDQFLRGLEQDLHILPFTGAVETASKEPQDATGEIALELARRYSRFRQEPMR
jgi:mitochondrial fission protein ELM1